MIFLYLILALLILIGLVLALKIKQLKAGNKKAAADRASLKIEPLADIGSVGSFSLLPLVDFYTDDDRLKTEPGVSYLIKAVNPEFIALSPHDSSDWSLAQFKDAFGDRCHELKVGRELRLA